MVISSARVGRSRSRPLAAAPSFRIDAGLLRRGLLVSGYAELAIAGAHVAALAGLPPLRKDPFDRMLVAQAMAEGVTLLTGDPAVAQYPGRSGSCDAPETRLARR